MFALQVAEAHFSLDHHKLATPLTPRVRAKVTDALVLHEKDEGAYFVRWHERPADALRSKSRSSASRFIVPFAHH